MKRDEKEAQTIRAVRWRPRISVEIIRYAYKPSSSSSSCAQPRGRRGTKTWRCNEELANLHSHEAKGKCLQQSVERGGRERWEQAERKKQKERRTKEERRRGEREMRYRKTPAANAARRRGRRYRLASAFPRRRYLPAAAVSFLSPSSSIILVFFPRTFSPTRPSLALRVPFFPSLRSLASFSLAPTKIPRLLPAPLFSPLCTFSPFSPFDGYTLAFFVSLTRVRITSSSACTQPPSIHPAPPLSPLSLSTDYSPLHLARSHQFPYTYPVFLLLLHLPPPRPLDSFPSDAVTGVAPAPNSYKIDGQEPHRERGWWVTPSVGNFSPSQLPRSSARPSIRPSFTHTEVCAYTLCTHARVRAAAWQLDERGGGGGNGAKAKRRRELCSFARTTGRDGEGRWLIRKEREGWRSEEMVRSEERGCEGRGCETETRTRGTNRERERERANGTKRSEGGGKEMGGRGEASERERKREGAVHEAEEERTQAPRTRADAARRRCIGSCTPATPGTSHVVGLPSTAIHGGQLLLLRPQVVHLHLRSSCP